MHWTKTRVFSGVMAFTVCFVVAIAVTEDRASADCDSSRCSDASYSALAHAAELRQSRVEAATIFGRDDRIPVEDTTTGFRTIAHLVLYWPDGSVGQCSGTVLSADAVLTAAHCLFDDEGQVWVADVLVAPGAAAGDAPFGAGFASGFLVPQGWTERGGSMFDFGLVVMEDRPFGNGLGPYLEIGAVPDSVFGAPGNVIATAGYPGDKPFGTQWFTADFLYQFDQQFIYTQMDARPGQSGSPILFLQHSGEEIVDVVLAGVFVLESPTWNIARRLEPVVVEALVDWCSDGTCSLTARPNQPEPSPTATATPTAVPTATAVPTGGQRSTTLVPGFNLIGGPLFGAVAPEEFMACFPPDSWDAIYIWNASLGRWRHYFSAGTVPTYVNDPLAGGIEVIPRLAGVVIVMNKTVVNPRVPEQAGQGC